MLVSGMLFERQRLLLNLLDSLGKPVGHTDFQKLLFLFTREFEKEPSYEFVPYRYGCFSFTSYADKRRLIVGGFLADDEQHWRLTDSGRQAARQKPYSAAKILSFSQRYNRLRGNALIAEVYRRYPYYTTRSDIVDKVLSDGEARKYIEQSRSAPSASGLLTIGYEGKSLEGYMNQLLQAGVSLLCDVRRNPLSRKYGFSKGTLSKTCESIGICYEHLPELGIASDKRRELNTQADYDALFADYEQNDLPRQESVLNSIASWIVNDRQRVALTCYELHPEQCHRHCVAKAVQKRLSNRCDIQHLEEACANAF